jgi:dTMP kinase
MKPAPPVTRIVIAVIYSMMFVTLEGLDGSGKTTQARLLGTRLEAEGREVVLTREPGGTPLGEEIRDLVLHGGDVAPWAEAALYAASRAQHVEQLIRPALARGATVICDRYVDSSVAYQGIARGLGLERVLELNLAAVEGLMPDRTILLEIGVAEAASRMGGGLDRIEREGDSFRTRVADAYRELARRFPARYVTIDGTAPPEMIAEEIHAAVRSGS